MRRTWLSQNNMTFSIRPGGLHFFVGDLTIWTWIASCDFYLSCFLESSACKTMSMTRWCKPLAIMWCSYRYASVYGRHTQIAPHNRTPNTIKLYYNVWILSWMGDNILLTDNPWLRTSLQMILPGRIRNRPLLSLFPAFSHYSRIYLGT